jgi:hypothetical protein
LAVALVLAAGFAYRIVFLLLPLSLDDDTTAYSELARNWFQHGVYGFLRGGAIEPTLIRLPGYPLFLGTVFSVFGDHLRVALAIQILMDLGSCWLLWDCARTAVSRRVAWVVLLLAVFCPFTAAYAATGLTECLSIFCIALAMWALARVVRAARAGDKALGPVLALAAAMAYGMLLRPDGVLLTAAFCAGLFWYTRQSAGAGRALRMALLTGVLAVLPLIPWTIRNYRTLHVIQPLAPRYVNNPDEFVPVGFFRWMRTWSLNFVDAGTVFWNLNDIIDPEDVPPRACSGDADQRAQRVPDGHTRAERKVCGAGGRTHSGATPAVLRGSPAVANCGYLALAAHGALSGEHLVVGRRRPSGAERDCDWAGAGESRVSGAGGVGIRAAQCPFEGGVAGIHRDALHFAGDDGESGTALYDDDVSDSVSGGRVCAGFSEECAARDETGLNSLHAVHGDRILQAWRRAAGWGAIPAAWADDAGGADLPCKLGGSERQAVLPDHGRYRRGAGAGVDGELERSGGF